MDIIVIDFFPIEIINKHKINGRKFDYEDYLIDLVNISPYFLRLSNGERYAKVYEQSHGEADVKTNAYELDFKLLVNQDYVNNKLKSLPAVDFSTIQDGYISINNRPVKGDVMTPSQANGLLPKYLVQLFKLTPEQITRCKIDEKNDLQSTVNMFEKRKNLFFLFPCKLKCTSDKSIVDFAMRLKNIFRLRDGIGYDTYLTIFRQHENDLMDEFYVLKYTDGQFDIIDKVEKFLIPSFVGIEQVASSIQTMQMKIIL